MDTQTEVLEKMTGEEKLEQAFMLSDFVRELAFLNISDMYPRLSHQQKMKKLRERIALYYHGSTRNSPHYSKVTK